MQRLSKFRRFCPALSAILLLLAFPPFNLWPLVLVALIPWLSCFPYESGKLAWKRGCQFGLVYMLGQLTWIQMLTLKWTGSLPLSVVPWVLGSLLGTLYFGFIGVLIQRCLLYRQLWAVPVIWIAIEGLRSYIPVFAYPWGLIASPLAEQPGLASSASLIGIFGTGGLVVVNNLTLLHWLRNRVDGKAAIYAALAFFSLFIRLPDLTDRSHDATAQYVAAIQPGIDSAFGDQQLAATKESDNIQRLLLQASEKRVDLAVLPEGVGRVVAMPPSLGFRIPKGLDVLVGAERGVDPIYQSALAYDGDAWQYIDKTRLVIFGEFVPGRHLIPGLSAFNLPIADLSAGKDVKTIGFKHLGTIAPIVCFESLFPDIADSQRKMGARFLCVMSNDDWFVGTPALEQLRQASVFRAIENQEVLARAASTGYTTIIGSDGATLASVPVGVPGIATAQVNQMSREPTLNIWKPLTILCGVYAFLIFITDPRKLKKKFLRKPLA